MSQDQSQQVKASAESFKEWLGCLFWIVVLAAGVYWIINSTIRPAIGGVLDRFPKHQIELLWKAEPGTQVSLTSSDSIIILGRTRDDYFNYREAEKVGDSFGHLEMLEEQRIIPAYAGQMALILENHYLMVRVRILEGDRVDKAGWIPLSQVRMEDKD